MADIDTLYESKDKEEYFVPIKVTDVVHGWLYKESLLSWKTLTVQDFSDKFTETPSDKLAEVKSKVVAWIDALPQNQSALPDIKKSISSAKRAIDVASKRPV